MKRVTWLLAMLALLLSLFACGEEETPTATATAGLTYEAIDAETCALAGRGTATEEALIATDRAPDGKRVTAVLPHAFENDTALTSLSLPATVREIGAYAFAGCTGLTNFSFPDALTVVGDFAFTRCTQIRNVFLGSSLQSVGDSAFYGCSSLAYAFFRGDAARWSTVRVGQGNSAMTTELYLYSTARPTDVGQYWYYSGGQFRIW